MRAGIYVRISLDRAGDGLGVERQESLCRTKADQLGWTVAEVYSDNDVSATSSKPRPSYERMLADLRAGTINAVVVYAIDRLTRRPMELETFIDLVEKHGVALANVGGEVDLSTEYGQFVARTMGNVARLEAQRTGKRVSDEKAQRAGKGIPHKGRNRLFGYDDDWNVIDKEAAIVKEMFLRRASGESTTSIATDLTKRGIKTVAGNDWKSGTLSETLKKTVYKGKVSYKGVEVSDSVYPALVDAVTFDQAQANLANDSKGTNARRYLLSGILVCGHCLTQMKGNPSNNMYRCAANYGGCGRLSVRIKIADGWALWAAMTKHSESRTKPAESVRNYTAELDALAKEIEHVQAMTREEVYSVPKGAAEVKSLNARIRELTREQAKAAPRQNRITQSYLDFHKMNLSQQRVFVSDYIETIRVGPSVSHGNQMFDPSRFEFFFTDDTSRIPRNDDPDLLED